MKNYNQLLKSTAILCLGIFFVQCSDADDTPQKETIPLFTEADLSMIHNDGEQSWYIAEVVNKYYDPTYDLEITIDCVTDDVYTFSAETESVAISYGEVLCFEDIDDGIFTADHEFFESNLMFNGDWEVPTIYLHFARGYINEDQTAVGVTFTYYKLAELSENRMVFQKGAEYLGEYDQALIFESIE